MQKLTRCAAAYIVALGLVAVLAGGAQADTKWPSLVQYTLSLSSDDTARYQTSLGVSGPINQYMSAKVNGWWIGGIGKDRAFVGDAYIDFNRSPIYLAAGRKFVVFGPAGVLVSPGIYGGQARVDIKQWQAEVISGTIAFTPGTGTTRFTFAGNRAPSDESMTAARLAVTLTAPGAKMPVTIGGNWIDVLDDNGTSVDASIGVLRWLTLYGEAASFEDADANVYGIKLSDAGLRNDGKAWIIVFYHEDIDLGFVPTMVGASAFFEGQTGWAGGLYYQMNPRYAIGAFADTNNAILTLFGTIPL